MTHSTTPASSSLMQIAARPEAVMARGRGSWLWDEDGNRYLDFVQGWAVCCLGHAPDIIRDTLAEQSAKLLTPSPAFHNRPQLELANALCRASDLERVFFCNSGAEANEGAIKLARKWGQRERACAYEIITTFGAFHGRTLATMAATGKPGWDDLFPPRMEGFKKVEFGSVEAVEAAISNDTLAIMVEPIQGEAGVVVPPTGYLQALREIADRHGVLLIFDEIQTGMGRTGPLFAHQWEEDSAKPDIMTLGKGLGGGVPLAALLARESVACFEPGDQGGTYNGNPLMTAVGGAVLKTLEEPTFREASKRGAAYLREQLDALAGKLSGVGVRGRGHLLALVLPEPIALEVKEQCFADRLLINAPTPALLRFMPALNVGSEEIDGMIDVLEPILSNSLTHQPGDEAAQEPVTTLR